MVTDVSRARPRPQEQLPAAARGGAAAHAERTDGRSETPKSYTEGNMKEPPLNPLNPLNHFLKHILYTCFFNIFSESAADIKKYLFAPQKGQN